jgi:isopentenyl diphosphate isomerase/L-lactate dehydrogenase-like FMN-dependent dehydrogenase
MLLSIDDLRAEARRRLPRAVFDFIDGAAEDEVTLGRNERAFLAWTFSPRVLQDVSRIDQSTLVLGRRHETPLILAPTGLCGMAATRGEIPVARAAGRAHVTFTVSSLSATSIEDVAEVATGPLWFQLYIWRDRALTNSLVERAARAGYEVLVVTADVPVFGQRERDHRNGATIPPRLTVQNALDMLRRPAWLMRMLREPRIEFANLTASRGTAGRPFALSQYINTQFDPTVTWKDVAALRSIWKGAIVVKGIMSAEDARHAADEGVDGIVVSNHGGRQLDGLPGSLDVLPAIVEAVGSRIEILFDGGIRRGTDVVKALALGARACMIGRPYLYGLGAAGERGVEMCISILLAETARAMALLGRTEVMDLDSSVLRRAPH